MHKIKKGIKKKIKGKKGKEEEIFTEEEFERYKKQKEEAKLQKEEEEDTNNELHCQSYIEDDHIEETEETKSEEESAAKEDWRNYLSSSDVVLKKTSENLEHIKESSFYQTKRSKEGNNFTENTAVRTVTPSDLGRDWVNLDKGGFSDDEEESNKTEFPAEPEKTLHERVRGLKEIAPIENIPSVDTEDYADIFDTTYVDQVESGDIKLHIIPDSPTDYDPSEPDPFDTSGVEKILHTEKAKGKKKEKKDKKDSKKKARKEVKPVVPVKPVIKKKILVNLGSAVQALTSDTTTETLPPKVNSSRSNRRVPEINLLGTEEEIVQSNDNQHKEGEATDEKESGVDSKLISEVIEKDNSIFACEANENSLQLLDNSETPELNNECDIDSTSSGKEVKLKEDKDNGLKNIVDEFDEILKDTEPESNSNLELITQSTNKCKEVDDEFSELAEESLSKNKENLADLVEDDPFDTSAVDKVIGDITSVDGAVVLSATKVNDKIKEDIFTTENIESDPFDTSEVSHIVIVDPFETFADKDLPETLIPQCASNDKGEENFDPFDTSAVGNFGKTELKYLEEELLSNLDKKEEEEDFDFNPREEVHHISKERECLLSETDDNIIESILSPQQISGPEEDIDPFDTTIADKLEIKHLEKELLEDSNTNLNTDPSTYSNPDNSFISNTLVLAAEPALTAAINADIDPFDTSVADSICRKASLIIENNFDQTKDHLSLKLKPPRPPSPACLLTSTPLDENPALLPTDKSPQTDFNIEIYTESDPFDTSIAAQFGKTELKVLESELLTKVSPKVEEDFSNFNPREQEYKDTNNTPITSRTSPICLLTSSDHGDQSLPPLAPGNFGSIQDITEIDPFDTSVADKLGTSELSYFESKCETENNTSVKFERHTSNNIQPPRPPVPANPTSCVFAVTPTDNNPALQPSITTTETKQDTNTEEFDPFDTSIADKFGKTELKVLEDTLFTNSNSGKVFLCNQDDDIDIKNIDHIFSDSGSLDNQPILNPTSDKENISSAGDYDPFDTGIAEKFGNTELRALENEFLSDSGLKRYLSEEEEFNPRQEDIKTARILR